MTPISETQDSRLKNRQIDGDWKEKFRFVRILFLIYLFGILDYGSLFCLHIGHIQMSTAVSINENLILVL